MSPTLTQEPRTGQVRGLAKITSGIAASDGDGVRLTRIIGSPEIDMVDPFLLLDSFSSDNPGDYIGGFPSHPHRGFETVTYLLNGRMRHKDNAGHEGVIEAGGIQWMTAGRGIIHSEMPEQENGLLQGFQLWVNLPASDKMTTPTYREFSAEQIPVETHDDGTVVRVIAGTTDDGTEGAVDGVVTNPLYLDVSLATGTPFRQSIPSTHGGFVHVITGAVRLTGHDALLSAGSLGVLGQGDRVEIQATTDDARFLLIAGQSLKEPVARGGPFVMNTKKEVLQAFQDFHNGRF
jgi:redox-sensitive bicupin YhaK (pirin superfamily)